MWNIGPTELIIILVVVLIIFGPKNLPKIGQALGRGIKEFKDASKGLTDFDDDNIKTKTQNTTDPYNKDNTKSISSENSDSK